VRVLTSCARCGAHVSNGLGVREVAYLRVDGHLVRHELLVCRECDAQYREHPTRMEAAALARNAAYAVEVMEFAQEWSADLGRVKRTARHFLGDARTTALAEELRETYLAQRAHHDAQWETYRQRVASRDFIPDHGEDDDDVF
jgi:hypothetical protein